MVFPILVAENPPQSGRGQIEFNQPSILRQMRTKVSDNGVRILRQVALSRFYKTRRRLLWIDSAEKVVFQWLDGKKPCSRFSYRYCFLFVENRNHNAEQEIFCSGVMHMHRWSAICYPVIRVKKVSAHMAQRYSSGRSGTPYLGHGAKTM